MSASSNYNAITNLTETVIDYLVVDTAEIDTALIENLDCNVGTIDTLTSTTATLSSANIPTLTTTTAGITTANITTENTTTSNITTANITTSNTTILNTNNIQANPNSSDITIYTSHTGAFNLGNISNTNGIRMNNKLQMATDKQIEITPTGHLACETIRGYSFGNPVSLYLTQTGTISFGNTSNTNAITINQNITLPANKIITLNATGGKVLCDVYTGTTASSNLTIGESGNTGTLTIYKTIVSPTMSGTLSVNDIQGTTTSSAITLFTLSSVSSPLITLGNLTGGTFTINPNTTMNGNLTLASSKIITLNSTGGKVLCNVYTGTTTSSNLTIGESGNTGDLSIFKTIVSSNTYSGTNTYSGGNTHSGSNTFSGATNTFNNTIACNTFQGTTTSSAITLFTNSSVSTPTITLGNTSGGTLTINPNTAMNGNLTLASSKTITLNTTGGKVLCNVYTGTTTSSNLTIGESGNTGDLSIFKTIVSSNTYSGTNTFSGGNTHSGSNTFSGATNTFNNTIVCNTISGALLGNITLYGSGIGTTISLGSLLGGGLSIFENTTLGINKNLTLQGTGKVLCNVYTGTTTSSNLTIGESGNTGTLTIYKTIASPTMSGTLSVNDIQGTTTSSSITLFTNSSVSSPTITLGNTSGGNLTINPNIVLPANKTITLNATGGKVLCDVYTGTTTSSNLTIGESGNTGTLTIYKNISGSIKVDEIQGQTTSSSILLFTNSSVSSPTITLGNTNGGNLTINPSIVLPANKTITLNATGGKVLCNVYTGTTTSSNLTIGESGNTGTLTIYKTIASPTMSGTLSVNDIQGTTTSSSITLFTNSSVSSPTITLGNTSGGNLTINPNVVLPANKTITLNATGGIVASPKFNSTSATQQLQIGATNTTAIVWIAPIMTTASVILHNTSGSGFVSAQRPIQIVGEYSTATLRPSLQFYQSLTISTYEESFIGHILGNGIPYGQYSSTNLPTVAGWVLSNDKYFCLSTYVGGDRTIEASSFLLSANTVLNVNPGDYDSMIYIDEDIPGGPGTWTGYRISVSGGIVASSDRRIKRAIVNHDDLNILDKIEQLQVVDYKLKRPDGITRPTADQKYNRVHTGYIAQDVKLLFPEIVEKNDDDLGILSIDYTKLNYKYQIAVQRLITQNKQQQTIIDDLTTRLARLEQILLNP